MSQPLQRNDLEETGWTYFHCSDNLAHLVDKAIEIAKAIFALPEEQKLQCSSPETNYQSGWRKPEQIDRPTEVWHISHTDPPESWPVDFVPERTTILELLDQSIKSVGPHLDEYAQNFGGVAGELYESLQRGISVIRLLYYSASDNTIRFSAHTDFGLASLFVAETSPGLELKTRQGEWRLVNLERGKWILAAGEMLAARSAGVIPPALHRVISTPEERFAIAIFLHPDRNYSLAKTSEGKILTAGEFFDRLMGQIMASKNKE